MIARLSMSLAQLNPTVGDIGGNLAKARAAIAEAARAGSDLVAFPELFLVGYPPEDLVLKPALIDAARGALETLARETGARAPAVVVGLPWREGDHLHNAVAVLDNGRIETVRLKNNLPNYGPFDEKRVFVPGPLPGPAAVRGVRLGLPICEDIWTGEVIECLSETGAELLLSPNGSPFERGKSDVRLNLAMARVVEANLPLVYLNQVGGQDELVFDGGSFVLNADRTLALQMPWFEEAQRVGVWQREAGGWRMADAPCAAPEDDLTAIYRALMLGLRDYVHKNGFPSVVLGLSGGIDSALTALVAVDALGASRVSAIMMPSRFTRSESRVDAQTLAAGLGIALHDMAIEPIVEAFSKALAPLFGTRAPDTTEENIQARVRGVLLMAASNKLGPLLLTTGNKSEMSVGYATLYGDMCGGFNVLKDLYKTQVFSLARWRNAQKPKDALGPGGSVIPERVIVRPPSAELSDDQTDQDTLPAYDILDDILERLIEEEARIDDIVARGHDRAIVRRVAALLARAEYKRRQAPPGVKITRRSFGRDRRYPITNGFRDDA